MTQKEVAIKCMEEFDIYKPYIRKFEKDGTITLFEGFGGFYIDEDNEPELLAKIKEFEAEYDAIVYAVTHEFTAFGELYDFLIMSKYEEEWEDIFEESANGYAFAYVWNKTDDWCSEFGTISVESFGGGIKRVG
jgi:hypothetical protein